MLSLTTESKDLLVFDRSDSLELLFLAELSWDDGFSEIAASLSFIYSTIPSLRELLVFEEKELDFSRGVVTTLFNLSFSWSTSSALVSTLGGGEIFLSSVGVIIAPGFIKSSPFLDAGVEEAVLSPEVSSFVSSIF